MLPCYGVHITVCAALLVCILCQPVHSLREPSLHQLDFFLEIFLWRLQWLLHRNTCLLLLFLFSKNLYYITTTITLFPVTFTITPSVIQCSCNRVDWWLLFVVSQCKTATKLYQCLLYMENANLFFLFYTNSHMKMATRGKLKHATIHSTVIPACMCQLLGSSYDFSAHVGRIVMPVQ